MPDFRKANLSKKRELYQNSLPEENDILEVPAAPVEEPKTITVDTEVGEGRGDVQTVSDNPVSKMGRPLKKKAVKRNNAKTIYFDEETTKKMKDIKYVYDFNYKDIVFVATREFLNKNFPQGLCEDLEKLNEIKKLIKELYDE